MEYPKIQSLFKRDMSAPGRPIIIGEWTLPEFEYLKDNTWHFSEKIDGTNIRVIWDGQKVEFRGRTDKAVIPTPLREYLEGVFTVENLGGCFTDPAAPVILYGEGYGKKIQKGHNYISDGVGFILFDVKIGAWWMTRETVEAVGKVLGVPVAPLVGEGTLEDAIDLVKAGFTSLISENREYMAEGVVVRPAVYMFARNGRRIIAKIKHRDFSLHPELQIGNKPN